MQTTTNQKRYLLAVHVGDSVPGDVVGGVLGNTIAFERRVERTATTIPLRCNGPIAGFRETVCGRFL